MAKDKRFKTVLALGGGGSRGLAHLGVIRALVEEKIQIDTIVGTSMGAIIGAMYLETGDPDIMLARVKDYFSSSQYKEIRNNNWRSEGIQDFWEQLFTRVRRQFVFNTALQKKSLGKIADLENTIRFLVESTRFDQLDRPFTCVSCDLVSGDRVLLNSGDLHQALTASSAVPGFLPPVNINGRLLCDGLISSVIPTIEARQMGDFVIAIDVRKSIETRNEFHNALEILMRSDLLSGNFRANMLGEKSDFMIRPEVGQYVWSDFNDWEKIVEKGYSKAKELAPELKEKIAYFRSKKHRLIKKMIDYLNKSDKK